MLIERPLWDLGRVLVKAPNTAASYEGSGPWLEIYQITPVISGGKSIALPTDSKTFLCQDFRCLTTLTGRLSKFRPPRLLASICCVSNILHYKTPRTL
jgi:hypothetical protein